VIARLNWYFTERMGLGLEGRYYYTQNEEEADDETTEFFQGRPELFYHLTENHIFFIAYEYSLEYQPDLEPAPDDPDQNPERSTERSRIWAGIRLNFPI
jgi:hypothetical protein